MSLYSDIAFKSDTELSQEELNRRVKIIADAIEALRDFSPSWEAEVEALRSVGLDRINNALLPAYQQIVEIANLGALLSTSSTSSVTIGNGTKTFIVPEAKRLNFAPTPYLIAYANGDFDLAMIATVSSYSSATGELVLAVECFRGAGTYSTWNIGPVATTDDLEALRDQMLLVAADAAASKEAAATSASASSGFADAAAGSASDANSAKVAAETALGTFQTSYYGARATAPSGAPLGAQYLDTSQTPNVVKVLTSTGWAPTVTVSIGGSRQQIFVATQGQTGPFTVDGGFTNGCVNVNGVDLYHGYGVTLDAGAGTFTLATARDAGDVVVFKGYRANDAVDVFVKSEANERFVTGKQVQAFTELEKGQARANIGADFLAGMRNKVINGDFGVAQRAAIFSVGPGNGFYGPDRWLFRGTTITGGALSGQILKGADPIWGGSYMRLSRTGCTTAQYILQRIENLRQYSGKRVTVSFVSSNDAAEVTDIELYATYGTGGSPTATELVAQLSKTVPAFLNGVTHYVLDVPNLNAKTFGTNDDDYLDLRVIFRGTNNTTLRISKISLVMGDASSESDPFSPRHPQQELELCRRYYERRAGMNASGVCLQTTSGMFGLTFSPKRAAPTISIPIGVARIRNQSIFNNSPLVTGVALFTIGKEGEAHVQATVASGLTVGAAAILQLGTDAITFDAEL